MTGPEVTGLLFLLLATFAAALALWSLTRGGRRHWCEYRGGWCPQRGGCVRLTDCWHEVAR